jgi:hypothetical protein
MFPRDILRQWQWENDRAAFLAAGAAERERLAGPDPGGPEITDPVFGKLAWWADSAWGGTVKLTKFAPTAQVFVDAQDEEPPSDAQRHALSSFLEMEEELYSAAEAYNWEHYHSVVLEIVRPNTLELAEDDPNWSESEVYEAMPDLESPAQVWALLRDLTIHVSDEQDEGWSLDLEWKCTWDEIGEHNHWIAVRNGAVGDSVYG